MSDSVVKAAFKYNPKIVDIAAKEADGRYASMADILVESAPDNHVRCVASDGRILAVTRGVGRVDQAYRLPAAQLKRGDQCDLNGKANISQPAPRRQRRTIAEFDYLPAKECEGEFPDYKPVIPSEAGSKFIALDAELLLKLAKAVNDQDGEHPTSVLIAFEEISRVIRVIGKDGVGFLMPVNGEKTTAAAVQSHYIERLAAMGISK